VVALISGSANLKILYEDDLCVAVLKPARLATQAPRGIDSLEFRVRAALDFRAATAGQGDDVYLGVPHRLDRAVSGVVLLAKTRRAARTISRQFARRQVRKIYWACFEGVVEPSQGTWIDFLRKVPDQPRVEIVSPEQPGAQQAVLHYRVRGATRHGSWLEIELETGRMHQIRLQAAARGHPVIGDALYGSRIEFGPRLAEEREREIALLAREISFVQPDTHAQITVVAPCPRQLCELGLPEEV
jgi:23S rRNA pseudouridine1911/1915/1917 synthase